MTGVVEKRTYRYGSGFLDILDQLMLLAHQHPHTADYMEVALSGLMENFKQVTRRRRLAVVEIPRVQAVIEDLYDIHPEALVFGEFVVLPHMPGTAEDLKRDLGVSRCDVVFTEFYPEDQ